MFMKKLLTITAATLLACLITVPVIANASEINKLINNTVVVGSTEIEAGFSNGYASDSSSDLTAATVALLIDSKGNEKISTHIVFSHEDDASFELDEATISADINHKLTLTAGQLYLPFGSYESNMTSDSLPHQFSEARETAIKLITKQARQQLRFISLMAMY